MTRFRTAPVLVIGAVLLLTAPLGANNTGAGSGADLATEFGEQILSDLDSFAELTNQVLTMLEQGNSLIAQGQTILDGLLGASEVPNLDHDLTLGTMCLSHEACTACAQPYVTKANNAYTVLENNRALYVNTMRKYEMLDTAARGAAAGSAAAGAALAIQRARDIAPARTTFMTHLGEAQEDALNLLGASLQEIGACEVVHLGINTFLGISRNTLELMRLKYAP